RSVPRRRVRCFFLLAVISRRRRCGRHSHSELVLAGERLFSPAPLKHSSRTSGMLSVLELADLGSSHLSRVIASRRSLKRLLGSRSSSRCGLGGPMATSGFLLHLDAGFPAPTLLLVIDAVFQNSIGAARDRTRHRRLGHIGQLVSPPPAVAPGERIRNASRRVPPQ